MGDARDEFSGMDFGPVVQAGGISSVFVTAFPASSREADSLPPGPEVFFGRARELEALLADLSPRKAPKAPRTPPHARTTRAARRQAQRAWAAEHSVLMLSGQAGVGKTALALRAAGEAVRRHWYVKGIYADVGRAAETSAETAVFTALGGLLHSLGVSEPQVAAVADGRVAQYRSVVSALAKRGKPVLVVLDSVSSLAEAEPLLPPHPRNCAVVIGRHRLTGGGLAGACHHALGLFEPSEAVEFVVRALAAADEHDRRAATDPEAVRALSMACGRLPLALDLAVGRLVTDRRMPVPTLADRLQDTPRPSAPEIQVDPVRAVFARCCGRLPAGQARLLRLLSLYPGAHFGAEEAAALGGLPVAEAADVLMELSRARMLAASGPRFGGHRFQGLLWSYATDLAQTEESCTQRKDAVERLLRFHVAATTEADTWLDPAAAPAEGDRFTGVGEAVRWLDEHRPILIESVRTAIALGSHGLAVRLALGLTRYLELRDRTADRMTVLELAASAAHSAGDRGAEAECRRRLGHIHAQSYSASSALPYYGNAMTLFLLAGDGSGAAAVVGDVLALLDRYRARERDTATLIIRYESGLAICRRGGDPAAVAAILDTLGNLHQRTGAHHRAADCHAEALVLREQTHDVDGVAESLANLADAQRVGGDGQNAAANYERAAGLSRDRGDSRREAQAWENLGLVHLRAGRMRPARQAFEHAAEVFNRGGPAQDAERVRGRLRQLRGWGSRRRAVDAARRQTAHAPDSQGVWRASGEGRHEGSAGTGARRPDRADADVSDVPDTDGVIDFAVLWTVADFGLDYGDDTFDDGFGDDSDDSDDFGFDDD
ncbi:MULTISPECIES: hypothetical protein [Streptomyces]|uniref:hypothetical protein n=1 Tax=Streptomyces TaxID=1883 RepID=UPI00117CB1A7|nr:MULTISPECIES: hypothetical protein [Streptomyces]